MVNSSIVEHRDFTAKEINDTTWEVYQERGQNSTVTFEPDGVWIVIQTDQILTSSSDRAYRVEQFIRWWGRTFNYAIHLTDKYGGEGRYDSTMASAKLLKQLMVEVTKDPCYLEEKEAILEECEDLASDYSVVAKLKTLVYALERQRSAELKRLKANLIRKQQQAVARLDDSAFQQLERQHAHALLDGQYLFEPNVLDSFISSDQYRQPKDIPNGPEELEEAYYLYDEELAADKGVIGRGQ